MIILSLIFKIFDPLGLLSPCTVLAKILMQKLWFEKLSWDDPVSDNFKEAWNNFHNELVLLNNLAIPRHVLLPNAFTIDLHGFCYSSERAYGACIYLRSRHNYGNTQVRLVCAKSKTVMREIRCHLLRTPDFCHSLSVYTV